MEKTDSTKTDQARPESLEAAVLSAWVQRFPSLWLHDAQLNAIFGGPGMANRIRESGWLRPFCRGNRCTLYRLVDVIECMRRIEGGDEIPGKIRPDQLPT